MGITENAWWADRWEQFDHEQQECIDCGQFVEDCEHAEYFTIAMVFLAIGIVSGIIATVLFALIWNWIF